MKLVVSLRAVLRVFAAEEPEEFRVAEQFGIEEMPVLALRPPRFQRDEAPEQRALG